MKSKKIYLLKNRIFFLLFLFIHSCEPEIRRKSDITSPTSNTSIYSWETSAWGVCSKTCGVGEKIRSAYCKRNDGQGVSDSFCTLEKPITKIKCNTHDCISSSQIYYSLHEEPVTIGYIDQNGVLKFEDKPRKGFLNLYDLTDPNIDCPTNDYECNADLIWLPSIDMGTPGSLLPSSKAKRFRVFMPPGTKRINFTMYTLQNKIITTALKFNTPPTCDKCTQSYLDDSSYFSKENSYSFEDLKKGDIYLMASGGHLSLFSRAMNIPDIYGNFEPLRETEEGWLFIDNYNGSDSIGFISYNIEVHKPTYLAWYTKYKSAVETDPANDVFGLLSGSSFVHYP